MNHISRPILLLVFSMLVMLVTITPGISAEIDDAAVFVDAFNAYQQKDYLQTIGLCDQLNQAFPESPLRDVTLLLIARASLKSGDNERAAKSVVLFTTEFPDSSLKPSLEEELKSLARRYQKGEVLAVNKTLQTAAHKVRSDMVKTEQERLARIKLEEERREQERLQALMLAKSNIKAVITLGEIPVAVPVGSTGSMPVEIANTGKNREEFILTVATANEYNAMVVGTDKPDARVSRIQLAAGETFKGTVVFTMPPDSVDGNRASLAIKAVSALYDDVGFQKETVVVCSAPLVRVVAKLAKQKVAPGEKLRFRVTVINAGSLSARNLIVRLKLPPQIDFQGAPNISFERGADGLLAFRIDQVDSGKLAEINLDVKITENSAAGQELRGSIEVVNNSLQRTDTFTANASVIQQKP